MSEFVVLTALTFVVSFIYSSVGHGGASGYLAVLSFFTLAHVQMATSALCLNLLVAGMAFYGFYAARHFDWKLTWPFTISSIPLAFVGGMIRISPKTYSLLLAAVLVFAAVRMIIKIDQDKTKKHSAPSLSTSLILGSFIGILSGVVGVGGGIFLSPLMILFHWADPKKAAATSAFFIVVNSMAGLFGRAVKDQFELTPVLSVMVVSAFFGGFLGSRLGANHFSGIWLRRILAGVLAIAAFKLFRVML